MTPELNSELNDLRRRVLETNKLLAAGEVVPEGLRPTHEELREGLAKLREARTGALAIKEVKEKAKKVTAGQLPQDLADLFKSS